MKPRRFVRQVLSLAVAAIAGVLSSGCAETATAVTAVETAQLAANVAGSIPGWVQQAVDAIMVNNNLNWGKPEKIIVTDTDYVLMYPTSAAQLKANRGVPRMIVISRKDEPQNQNRL